MSGNELRRIVSQVYKSRGVAIEGERIIAQARYIGNKKTIPGTSTHQMQQTILKVNAFCVIDKAFRIKDKHLKLK